MKLPVPKTLMGAASPMLLINWAFGIGVIEYPPGRPRRIISAVWSIVHFIMYLGFLKMANYSGIVEIQKSKIDANNSRVTAYFCAAFIAISMCLGQMRAKVIREAFSKLTAINNRLNVLGIPTDYESLLKAHLISLGIGFALISIMAAIDFNHVGLEFPTETSYIGFLLTAHYSLAFAFIIDYTVSSNLRYFGNRFQHLNTLLIKSDSLKRCETSFTQSNDQFLFYSTVISEIHGNNSLSIRAANKHWLFYIIKETRKIHRGLCKAATELNNAFGIQMLLSLALSFGQLIALLYTTYLYTVVSAWKRSNDNDRILDIILLIWIVFYTMKIILIADASETVTSEAKRTGKLINKLLSAAACDEDIRDEINIFSLQLLQNPLRFTASGFFSLNYSLVHGMIGSVTTYLIILIQMRNIYDSENVGLSS